MKFKLFGTEIYISFLFFAVITIMLATDRTGLLVPTFFAITMHETGHLFAMWALDCEPKQIKLIPSSIQITRKFCSGYRNDIIIALFGPLTNFVLFLSLYCNFLAFKNQTVFYYSLLNLIICFFNLLPVKGLDGGTVLFSLLLNRFDLAKATLIIRLITFLFALAVIIAAVMLTVKGKINISLYIIGLYLIIMSIIKM